MEEGSKVSVERLKNCQSPDVSQIFIEQKFPPKDEEWFDFHEDPFAWHYNKFLLLAGKDREDEDGQYQAREIYHIRGMIKSALKDNSPLASFMNLKVLALLLHSRVGSWPWVVKQLSWTLDNMACLAQSFEEFSEIFWLASNARNPKCPYCQMAIQIAFDGAINKADSFDQLFRFLLQPLTKEQRVLTINKIIRMGNYQDWGELLLHHIRYPLPYMKVDFILQQMKVRHNRVQRANILEAIEKDPAMAKAIREMKIVI